MTRKPVKSSSDRAAADAAKAPASEPEVKFSADLSRGFNDWFGQFKATIAITTYQVGKVIFFGLKPDNSLWVFNRNLGRCLGMAADETGFWVAGDHHLHRFANLAAGDASGLKDGDALFAPRLSYFTGDLDTHDVALDAKGEPVFVNTLFNCLARPSLKGSFEPVWTPPFISKLAAEDRCHLNGLAMVDGAPGYVTAVSTSDTFDGWRDQRSDGGVVIDVRSNEIVCTGLSMPHSPRWHDGKLWLHNSGTGEFGFVDLAAGKFEAVTFCPGYLRGLDFLGDFAVAGLSMPRGNKTFSGLALDDQLASRKMQPKAGLYFINTKTGDIAHAITLGGLVTELYDVTVLKDMRQPSMIGLADPQNARLISLPGR
jgi:uncharacterized protein (TIGR03032 family)